MELSLLVETIIGLVVILIILVFLLVLPSKKRAKATKKTSKLSSSSTKDKTDLESLRKIIRNRQSSTKELEYAVDMVLKHHGKIPPKMGVRVNPQFDAYSEMLMMLCRHPNTNKNIILKLDKELRRLNPEYTAEINDATAKGLESRGF